ncbi:hypothetical protein [Pendulispora albinea]|uniref:Uncharacterized protein n=1 Tax=Pendulispora albinea TaxID=2741071 RepID=A0ABZ2M0F7_9BACT
MDDPAADQRGDDLGTLGGFSTRAFGVSEDGSISGTAQNDQGCHEAFIWNPRSKKISGIGTLGGFWSRVTARSRTGQVAGVSQTEDGHTHPFIAAAGAPPPPPAGGCQRKTDGRAGRNAVDSAVRRSLLANDSRLIVKSGGVLIDSGGDAANLAVAYQGSESQAAENDQKSGYTNQNLGMGVAEKSIEPEIEGE